MPIWHIVLYSIKTECLSKIFGDVSAVDSISFEVEEGEVFGFLGPNGAGKSTTMMILTTLLKPTSGKAYVAGYDVVNQSKQVRQSIGYVQQEITVDEYLTGRENLLLHGRLNHIPKNLINSQIDAVLDLIELSDKQNDAVITYSGGMRKRLDIAGGLLHRPKVLFLDEPTVGLDIQTRRKIWEYIKKIHDEFKITIFLSTHYMEEADNLCDRIGIIDYGKIQTISKPSALKAELGDEIVTFSMSETLPDQTLMSKLKTNALVKEIKKENGKVIVFTTKGSDLIPQIFQITSELGIKINSISLTEPTLDDVFLSYTGRGLRDDGGTFNRKKEHAKMKRIRA